MAAPKTIHQQRRVYEGCNFFRQRLFLSTLSGIPVQIQNIRAYEEEPGIREFEASYLRLMDKLTNGTKIEVNETGTGITYIPGLLVGGEFEHDCSNEKSLGFYLEGIIPLGPFCKKPLRIMLRGVTNDKFDITVDTIKYVTLGVMKKFGINDGLDLKIMKRGAPPAGGGEIVFTCPNCRKLKPLHYTDQGKFKRIRGSAYSMKVAPAFINRMIDSAKQILTNILPDIYIYADHAKGAQSGNSPGFGMSLMVESTTGVMLSGDACSNPKGDGDPVIPEDTGKLVAYNLLQEVFKGGCVDSVHQSLVLLYMALGQMDVSKVLMGALTPYTIEFMRHMKDFFHLMYKIELVQSNGEESKGSDEKYIVSCVGVGYTNLSKTSI